MVLSFLVELERMSHVFVPPLHFHWLVTSSLISSFWRLFHNNRYHHCLQRLLNSLRENPNYRIRAVKKNDSWEKLVNHHENLWSHTWFIICLFDGMNGRRSGLFCSIACLVGFGGLFWVLQIFLSILQLWIRMLLCMTLCWIGFILFGVIRGTCVKFCMIICFIKWLLDWFDFEFEKNTW